LTPHLIKGHTGTAAALEGQEDDPQEPQRDDVHKVQHQHYHVETCYQTLGQEKPAISMPMNKETSMQIAGTINAGYTSTV
jgi:hypothetical protein